jgi:HD superfamily phosphohydrolase
MKIKRPKSIEDAVASQISKEREALAKCVEERDQIASRLAEFQKHFLPAAVREMGRRWLTDRVPNRLEAKGIDDPIYGHFLLNPTLATLLSHPLLQRLARVKQLSFSFSQFPSARHSRLSHSLGVAKNAEMALAGIFDRGVYYEEGNTEPHRFDSETMAQRDSLIQKTQLVAMLHDVGHGPFGHALDYYAGAKTATTHPDKTYTIKYVQRHLVPTLRSLAIDDASILSILRTDRTSLTGMDNFIGDVVDSSLDVDRMDYLMRDAHMTGLMMGFINTSALIDSMRPVRDQNSFILAYDIEALGYMEHLMLARDIMYSLCYEHPRKRAAERIFTRLIKSVEQDTSLGLTLDDMFALADEELTTLLRGIGGISETSSKLVEELMGDLDYVVVYELPATTKQTATTKQSAVSAKIDAWLGDVTSDEKELAYISRPESWERAIAQNSVGNERVWQIHVILPGPGAYQQAESETKLLTKDDRGKYRTVNFFDTSAVVKETLAHMNVKRQVIKIMCPAKLPPHEREQIRDAARAFFEAPDA